MSLQFLKILSQKIIKPMKKGNTTKSSIEYEKFLQKTLSDIEKLSNLDDITS